MPCFWVDIFVVNYSHSTVKLSSLEFPKTIKNQLSLISLLVVISVHVPKTEWLNEDCISVSLLKQGLQGKHDSESGHRSSVPLYMPFLFNVFNKEPWSLGSLSLTSGLSYIGDRYIVNAQTDLLWSSIQNVAFYFLEMYNFNLHLPSHCRFC